MELPTLSLDFIKRKRVELSISQQEMAHILGFKNASTYLKYERGEYSFKADHLPIIAKKFNCKIEELFFTIKLAKIASC